MNSCSRWLLTSDCVFATLRLKGVARRAAACVWADERVTGAHGRRKRWLRRRSWPAA